MGFQSGPVVLCFSLGIGLYMCRNICGGLEEPVVGFIAGQTKHERLWCDGLLDLVGVECFYGNRGGLSPCAHTLPRDPELLLL